jgi:hypothetical protein
VTHPQELLTGYVDGSLTESERADVEAHLATCATCREEMELARRAVTALRALPDERVPVGVAGPVLVEIRTQAPMRTPRGHRFPWAAGLAAAAVLIAVAVGVFPRLGQEGSNPSSIRASEGLPTPAAPGVEASAGGIHLEMQPGVDYDASKLEALAGAASHSLDQQALLGPNMKALSGEAATAEACLAEPGGLTARDRLVRLIQATYQGKPAYLGVYLETPKGGGRADRVVIWVVAKDGCTILSFASKRI